MAAPAKPKRPVKCPFCKHVLSDTWIKKRGASLMGKASGERKARSREVSQAAAQARWRKEKGE